MEFMTIIEMIIWFFGNIDDGKSDNIPRNDSNLNIRMYANINGGDVVLNDNNNFNPTHNIENAHSK